jgi:putative Mn2+ efflux pump MntP
MRSMLESRTLSDAVVFGGALVLSVVLGWTAGDALSDEEYVPYVGASVGLLLWAIGAVGYARNGRSL